MTSRGKKKKNQPTSASQHEKFSAKSHELQSNDITLMEEEKTFEQLKRALLRKHTENCQAVICLSSTAHGTVLGATGHPFVSIMGCTRKQCRASTEGGFSFFALQHKDNISSRMLWYHPLLPSKPVPCPWFHFPLSSTCTILKQKH